jgi:hypothetical protein
LFSVKNANFFAELIGGNILKIITSVPDGRSLDLGTSVKITVVAEKFSATFFLSIDYVQILTKKM